MSVKIVTMNQWCCKVFSADYGIATLVRFEWSAFTSKSLFQVISLRYFNSHHATIICSHRHNPLPVETLESRQKPVLRPLPSANITSNNHFDNDTACCRGLVNFVMEMWHLEEVAPHRDGTCEAFRFYCDCVFITARLRAVDHCAWKGKGILEGAACCCKWVLSGFQHEPIRDVVGLLYILM